MNNMELLIGMSLAFVLGATTVLCTLWVTNLNRTQTTLSPNAVKPSEPLSVEPKEPTPEEKSRADYLSQMMNMLGYDGTKQGESDEH
jgi:hypothetical protein